MWSALASTIDLYELLALAAVLLAACLVVVALIRKAPRELRVPLTIFNAFYLGTTVIGATLLASPSVRLFWMLMLPSMDASWLDVWDKPIYWLLLWAPLVVVNAIAWVGVRHSNRIAAAVSRCLASQIDPMSYSIVGMLMLGYCFANLAMHGLLNAQVIDVALAGDYRANIQLRTTMAATLGDAHYGIVYMGLPAVCVLALADGVTSRRGAAWVSFFAFSCALTLLLAATLTKGNLVVFGLAVVVTAVATGIVRARNIPLMLLAGLLLLTIMDGVLSGGGLFEVLRSINNIIFRMASGVPFYIAIFPSQIPHVGLDVGLSVLGIGPQVAANLAVANLMFPADTWVQGAIPAPAHIVGYAQGGLWWSFLTMVAVGALATMAGSLVAQARSALAVSVGVGGCIALYNTTQTEFVGTFLHSYGIKWWFGALAATVGLQKVLEFATAGRPSLQAVRMQEREIGS